MRRPRLRRPDPTSLTRCLVEGHRIVPAEPVPPQLPAGLELERALIFGREDQLHVVQGDRWLRADPLQARA